MVILVKTKTNAESEWPVYLLNEPATDRGVYVDEEPAPKRSPIRVGIQK